MDLAHWPKQLIWGVLPIDRRAEFPTFLNLHQSASAEKGRHLAHWPKQLLGVLPMGRRAEFSVRVQNFVSACRIGEEQPWDELMIGRRAEFWTLLNRLVCFCGERRGVQNSALFSVCTSLPLRRKAWTWRIGQSS